MSLPLPVDFAPMEADSARAIPTGPEWEYEPKWDGFRCLAFRDADEIHIMSKSGQPLARYFPGTKLLYWRPEKHPEGCKISQVSRESESALTLLD